MATILSIQSSVAYGHVGNSAATFPLMRRGVRVWPVITVHFSNHTGYGAWRGPLLSASDVLAVVRGIDERGVLGQAGAVLTGYQGAEDVGAAVLEVVKLVKSRNPYARWCCDPVLGDVGRGFYVRPEIPDFMRDRVVPAADIITPNQFELDFLTGRPTTTTGPATMDEVLAAADAARALGPGTVLVTSVVHADAAPGTLDMVVVDGDGAWCVTTPLLPRAFTGAGDLTSAMFLAGLLEHGDPAAALADTAAVVHGVLRVTVEAGSGELELVRAQDEIAHPTRTFPVVRLR